MSKRFTKIMKLHLSKNSYFFIEIPLKRHQSHGNTLKPLETQTSYDKKKKKNLQVYARKEN